jgi:hypothetical protein
MLYHMGWETANIHLGSSKAIAAVKKDLARRKGRWLRKAAKAMQEATLNEWRVWRRNWARDWAGLIASPVLADPYVHTVGPDTLLTNTNNSSWNRTRRLEYRSICICPLGLRLSPCGDRPGND